MKIFFPTFCTNVAGSVAAWYLFKTGVAKRFFLQIELRSEIEHRANYFFRFAGFFSVSRVTRLV